MTDELRILILEDVPTDAELMERELRKTGLVFISQRVETRDAFVGALAEFAPDVILADYKLPDFDGLSALAIACEKFPEIPFVFVTGTLCEECAVEALKLGAADYILKDRLPRLGPAVQRALEEAAQRAQLRHTEQAIRESEEKFRNIYHGAMDGIVLVDAEDGHILDANPAFLALLGYAPEELATKRVWELRPPGFVDRAHNHFREVLENGSARFSDAPLQARDGQFVAIETSAHLISYQGRRAVLSVVRDMREREIAQRKLQEQLDELHRFEKVAVGRELRMQELRNENARLKAQITALAQTKPPSA